MILLGHGAGGKLSHDLINEHFLPRLGNAHLRELLDSALIGDLALTTDAYVVSPRFFPGGDLGRLAICGTVNDLCMVGAKPLGLTAAFILEEGLPLAELDRMVDSMKIAAAEAGVEVVAGDTKVVPRGACDGAFITTSGVGRLIGDFRPSPSRVAVGDVVISSGTLGDHGIAVLACREGLAIGSDLKSDVAPLASLVETLRESEIKVHALRDPTRGGAAQSLIEIAEGAGVQIRLDEEAIPLRPAVRSACALLGLDPLYIANEGKLLALVPERDAQAALKVLHSFTLGENAAVIGAVEEGEPGCCMLTTLGARRTIRMASGELLPRIC